MLPKLPKKEPRPISISVRLSKKAIDALKNLAKEHNMSQADVIEYLLMQANEEYTKKEGKR